MNGVLRVLSKDIGEFLLDPRALAALLLLPSLILILVGQLRVGAQPFELLVVNASTKLCARQMADDDLDSDAHKTLQILEELSDVTVKYEMCPEPSPLSRLQQDDFDIVLDYGNGETTDIYVAETDPTRLRQLLNIVQWLRMTTVGRIGEELREEEDPVLQIFRVGALGGFPMIGAHVYYPQSLDRSLSLLPATVSLIICFLPFVIAAPNLFRERDARTLDVMLSAPGVSSGSIIVSKCLLALLVSVTSFVIMLATMQLFYELHVKTGMILYLSFLLLPVLSATFLGLAVSSLSSSQTHIVVLAALYFLLLNLFGGFFFAPDEGTFFVQVVSALLPLTYTIAPTNAWLYGAPVSVELGASAIPLLAQTLAYGVLAAGSWRYRRRRL